MDYRIEMLQRMSKGDLVVPEGATTMRGMAAPWAINVFSDAQNALYKDAVNAYKNNKPLPSGFNIKDIPRYMRATHWQEDPTTGLLIDSRTGQLVEDLLPKEWANASANDEVSLASKMRVGDNDSLFFNSLSKLLGVSRFPATIGSVQVVKNKTNPLHKNLFDRLGLDPNALYLSPSSPLLGLMQGEDFDGDVNDIIDLGDKIFTDIANIAENQDTTMQDMMNIIWTRSVERHNNLLKDGKISKSAMDRSLAKLQHKLFGDKNRFDTNNPEDIGAWASASALQPARMGPPNAILRNAWQMNMTPDIAQAVIKAFEQYDTNSTSAKKGFYMDADEAGGEIMRYYKDWSEMYNRVKKYRDDKGHIDYSKFKDTNLFKINGPSVNMSGNILSSLIARSILKQRGYNINEGVDWELAFQQSRTGVLENLIGKGIITDQDDLSKETKRFANAMEHYHLAQNFGDFVMMSDKDKVALTNIYRNARNAEMARRHGNIGVVNSILEAFGSNVVTNINDSNYGLTESTFDKLSPQTQQLILSMYGLSPDGQMVASDLQFDRIRADQKISYTDRFATTSVIEKNLRQLRYLKREAIEDKIDNTGLSITSLMQFAESPLKWISERLGVKDPKNDFEGDEHTAFGHAAEDVIQEFYERRERLINQKKAGRTLSDDEVKGILHDLYYGDDHTKSFKDRFLEELKNVYTEPGKAEEVLDQIVGPKSRNPDSTNPRTVYTKYRRVADLINPDNYDSRKESLNSMIPSETNKYLGSEHEVHVTGVGKQLGNENKDINFTGHEDLLFQKLDEANKGKLAIFDIKTFGGLAGFDTTRQNKLITQLLTYAIADEFQEGSAIKDLFGNPVVSSGVGEIGLILADALDEQVKRDFSDQLEGDWQTKHRSRLGTSVALFQKLAENGLTPASINLTASAMKKTLWGDIAVGEYAKMLELDVEASRHRAGLREKRGDLDFNSALTEHDNYREAINRINQATQAASKIVRGTDPDKTPRSVWDILDNVIKQTQEEVEYRRDINPTQAASLQRKVVEAQAVYAQAPDAAINSYAQLADKIQKVNQGLVPNKEAQEYIDQWKELNTAFTSAKQNLDQVDKQLQMFDNAKSLRNRIKEVGLNDESVSDIEEYRKLKARETELTDEETERMMDLYRKNTRGDKSNFQKIEQAGSLEQYKKDIEALKTLEQTIASTYPSEFTEDILRDKKEQAIAQQKIAEQAKEQYRKDLERQISTSLSDSYTALSGGVAADKDVKSIAEQINDYRSNISSVIAGISEFKKEGIVGNEFADDQILKFNELLEDKNMNRMRKQIINDSLDYYKQKTNDVTGVTDIGANIDAAVAKKRAEIQKTLANIHKTFGSEKLGTVEQQALNTMVSSLNDFDYNAYRQQVEKEQMQKYEDSLIYTSKEQIERKYDKLQKEKDEREETLQKRAKSEGVLESGTRFTVYDKEAQRLLEKSQSQDLNKYKQLELNQFDIQQQQSSLALLQSITGVRDNAAMRELSSASFANKLEQWITENGTDKLPDGLKKYLKEDGKIDKDKITKDYEDQYNHALELQNMRQKAQYETQSARLTSQMAIDQARFDMSRTQYGPTIIGRAFQYDDQQLLQWQSK